MNQPTYITPRFVENIREDLRLIYESGEMASFLYGLDSDRLWKTAIIDNAQQLVRESACAEIGAMAALRRIKAGGGE